MHRASIGPALTGVGAIMVVVAFTVLSWMRGPVEPGYDPPAGSDFADIRSHIDRPHWATEANIYFGWLGWVLLAALVLGVATLAARPRTRRARMPLAALGCVAAFATYRGFRDAINFNAENVTARAGYGYWIAVLGFLTLAISAASLPGRSTASLTDRADLAVR